MVRTKPTTWSSSSTTSAWSASPTSRSSPSDNYRWHAQRFDDDFYYLDRIVIAEEMRRRGLAGFVYDAMEDVARRFGRMTLEVNVDPPNHGSLAFHQQRGYVEVGRLGEPGHVVGLMAKELSA